MVQRVRKVLLVGITLIWALCTGWSTGFAKMALSDDLENHAIIKNDGVETLLHSLALYIIAAEILAYLQDGAGDVSTLQNKYKEHPGWIPAFEHASFDMDEQALFVPLGQFMWKISTAQHRRMQFGLLHPRDKGLSASERRVLLHHMFRLIQNAETLRDAGKALQNAKLANALLYPGTFSAIAPVGRGGKQSIRRKEGEFSNSL